MRGRAYQLTLRGLLATIRTRLECGHMLCHGHSVCVLALHARLAEQKAARQQKTPRRARA